MGFRFASLISLLIALVPALGAANPDIRVRIDQQKTFAQITGEKLQLQVNRIVRFPVGSSLSIEQVGPSRWKVNGKTYRRRNLRIVGENLKVGAAGNEVEVPERLQLNSEASGFDIIAELPFEKYLLDVVASEVPSSWPLETLKAQAVAARTYAAYLMKERAGGSFDLDSTTQDQVFNYRRHLKVPNSSVIISAVNGTAGHILVDSSDSVIKAFFHGHCGGETEERGAVWPEYPRDPNFKRLKDADSCGTSGAWSAQITKQEVLTQFGASDLLSIAAQLNKDSVRVELVELKYLKNGKEILEILKSQDFRRIFGYTKIRSTIFTIQQLGDVFNFSGRGFGHGVGMCQTGSRWMGASGSTYDQILSRYYEGTKLTKM